MAIDIRELAADDIANVRRLQILAPTRHLTYTLRRFPKYMQAMTFFESASQYFSRQHRTLGAFCDGTLVGTVGIMQVRVEAETPRLSESALDEFYREFTQQEIDLFYKLCGSLVATFIGAPEHSFLIHSLHVLHKFRRQGVATDLMDTLVSSVTSEQKAALFVETARLRHLRRFVESFGFRSVKRTFSLSERFTYGTWGSQLYQYANNRAE